jgi:UDPglucose 6-dehydrogenase
MTRIFVVGSGVVGTATGRGLVAAGHDVTFVDTSPERVAALTAEGHDARPALTLHDEPGGYIFLTLPTPSTPDGYELSAFRNGVQEVGVALRGAEAVHTVVVRSTVPPGTTQNLVKPLLEQVSGTTEGRGFTLAANPEFLRAACADDDFRWPWMTVIGTRSRRVAERLQSLLEPFGGQLRVFDRPETAELVKCAHNIFNAAKISFWNEMWLVCDRLGLPLDEVATTVADSAEGSYNRRYGIRGGAPYGGVCLPKDTAGFLGFARDLGVGMPLLSAVIQINNLLDARMSSELDGATQPAPLATQPADTTATQPADTAPTQPADTAPTQPADTAATTGPPRQG